MIAISIACIKYFFSSEVAFMASFREHTTFPYANMVMVFTRMFSNVGHGYVDDITRPYYGTFIAPQNGTYQFNVVVCHASNWLGADLMKNGARIIGANNGGSGTGSLSAILDLTSGDQVFLKTPNWLSTAAIFDYSCTSFSGHLV